MSTQCLIGQKREDGIHYFHCEYDGYVHKPGVGDILLNNYTIESAVTKLIDTFDCRHVKRLEDAAYASIVYPDTSDLTTAKTKKEYTAQNQFADYIYLWESNKWKVFTQKTNTFVNLEDYNT